MYPQTDLDVGFSRGELTQNRLKHAANKKTSASSRRMSAAPDSEKTAKFEMGVPSSEQRKLRRCVLCAPCSASSIAFYILTPLPTSPPPPFPAGSCWR